MNYAAKELSALGVAAKQKKAAERFSKVRELRKQGVSAARILEMLNAEGADWKIRTIYRDITKIKQIEATAPKKIAHWIGVVDQMRGNRYRSLSENIRQLNARGFNIDAKKVTDYDTLKQEIVKSINADIHDIL